MNHSFTRVTRTVFFSLFLLSGCATAPPVTNLSEETADLEVIVSDLDRQVSVFGAEKVIAVFDLDNTLLAMEQGLGSDQWYEWQKEQSAHDRCDPRVVGDRLAVQGALYFASAMRPTQDNAPDLLRRIQDMGVSVIALTSRGPEFRLQTFRELRRNGYDFRRSALNPQEGWPENFLPDNGIRPVRYEDGVFLTAGQHKGKMLDALLRKTGTPTPSVIVMVDDKQDNLVAIHETFDGTSASVRTWRYSAEDNAVQAFNPEMSDYLWQQALPALQTLESVFGADHYQIANALQKDDCGLSGR